MEQNQQPKLTPEELAKQKEEEEDKYFEEMLAAFQKIPRTDKEVDDDIEFFTNHPLNCKELTAEMLDKPEFKALQNLAYEGTPEEVCKNFKNHALEALSALLLKETKNN